jgi:hypothetical protein
LEVNLYCGLNAFELIWRAILLLASMAGVRISAVQYSLLSLKMVSLKMWLLPKKSSARLMKVSMKISLEALGVVPWQIK